MSPLMCAPGCGQGGQGPDGGWCPVSLLVTSHYGEMVTTAHYLWGGPNPTCSNSGFQQRFDSNKICCGFNHCQTKLEHETNLMLNADNF